MGSPQFHHYHSAQLLPFVLQYDSLYCWGIDTITVSPSRSSIGQLVNVVTGVSLVVFFKITSVCLKSCNPAITIMSVPEDLVMSGREVVPTPVRLVWADWSIANISKKFYQSTGVVVNCWSKCHIFHSLYQPHVFLFVWLSFCRSFSSRFFPTLLFILAFLSQLLWLLYFFQEFYSSVRTLIVSLIFLIQLKLLSFIFRNWYARFKNRKSCAYCVQFWDNLCY